MFEGFLVASHFPADKNDRRAALLRLSLGTERYSILMSWMKGEKTSYDDTLATLKALFYRHSMAIFERAKFALRYRHSGDSVTEFVTCQKELANQCNFEADQFDIKVRDQFVPHLMSDKIRELRYQEPDTHMLDGAVQKAITLERAMAEATSPQGKALRTTSARRGPVVIVVKFTSDPWR